MLHKARVTDVHMQLGVSAHARGMYLLELRDGERRVVGRVLVE